MNLTPIVDRLRQRIGLSPEVMGRQAILVAVRGRMHAVGLDDSVAFASLLDRDAKEFQNLVDEVVVPETWFFRGGVFVFLAGHIRQEVSQRPSGSVFRVLSLPCSTGEEPYSLAMALSEAGVPGEAWTIDGVDLSQRQLERARRGRFSQLAFRQTDAEARQRHFRPVVGGWEIDVQLREAVRFRQGNLIDPGLLAGEPRFDLIFCRNLFIYLDAAARQLALANLDRLLAADGLLCMGHAEPLNESDGKYRRFGPEGSFLYRRVPSSSNPPSPPKPGTSCRLRLSGGGGIAKRQAAPPHPQPLAPEYGGEGSKSPIAKESPSVKTAQMLADAGQIDQALATCLALLVSKGPSADLYCLLGIIHHARHDDTDAADCFAKALYLQPDHREALRHLLLLAERNGNGGAAARLRRRLERLLPEEES